MNNRKLYLVILTALLGSMCYGQSYDIIGTVTDSLDQSLPSATVVTLNAQDSLLVGFSYTNDKGTFEIKDHDPGTYILQVTYIGYKQYSQSYTLLDKTLDVGAIKLSSQSAELDEVTIKGEHTPILIKKDTVEYNAAAFETQPNEVVEDLLKKLPGIEVEDDGTIIAHGEEVKEVLVDGRKFFGGDTQVATKNLPADAIDKVQVYDKMSDMSEFTGVDDGEREKAINLELKEDRKQGYFGNVSAGLGTNTRYKGKFNINRFDHQMQIAALGNFNNINEQGFSTESYSGRINAMNSSGRGGGVSNNLSSGLSTTNAGGLNWNYIPNSKTQASGSYFINDISNQVISNTIRENFLERGNYLDADETNRRSANTNHKINVEIEQKIDSSQIINVRGNLNLNISNLEDKSTSNLTTQGQITENTNNREYDSTGDNVQYGGQVRYRKKLGSENPNTIVLQANYNDSTDEIEGLLDSEITFFPDDEDRRNIDLLLQDRIQDNSQNDLRIKTAFVRTIDYDQYVELGYEFQNYDADRILEVFDILSMNEPILNDDLSSFYNRDYQYHKPGITYQRNTENTMYTGTIQYQRSSLTGSVNSTNPTISRAFNNFLPKFSIRHTLSQSTNLSANYSTSVREPSLTQLQPITNNTDPLRVIVGNTELVPEYRHRLRLMIRNFDAFSFRSVFAFLNVTYTRNSIINLTTIDERFVRTTQPINAKYKINTIGSISYSSPLAFLQTRVNIRLNTIYNRSFLFINENENRVNQYTNRLNFSIENRNKDHIDISLGNQVSYTVNRYSENAENNQNFLTHSYFTKAIYNLSQKLRIGGNFDYRIINQQGSFDVKNTPYCVGFLRYSFLKGMRGELTLGVYDILNRNLGEERTSGLNYIQYRNVESLGRYGMISFTYSLRSAGQGGGQGQGIRDVRRNMRGR